MDWKSRILRLKEVVTKEKESRTEEPQSGCIHGEENCVRCIEFDKKVETGSWEYLDQEDVKKVIYAIPESITSVLRMYDKKAVIAGGFIRAIIANEKVNDLDIFVNSASEALALKNELPGQWKERDKVYDGSIDRLPVQIVFHYPFTEPYQILEQFDYTVTKAAIWFDGIEAFKAFRTPNFVSTCHDKFYRDLARKILVYGRSETFERLESMPRLLKYISYGYTIGPKDLAEVIARTCLCLDLDKDFEEIVSKLESMYKPSNLHKNWEELTTPYVKPVQVRYSYES